MTGLRPHAYRRWTIAAVALLVLSLAHTAVWLWATGRLQSGYQLWLAGAGQQGWTVSAGPPLRAGWPLAATLHVAGVSASGPGAPGMVAWTAERLDLSVWLARPTTLILRPQGQQTLRIGHESPIPVQASQMEAEIDLNEALPSVLTASGLALSLPAGKLAVRTAELRTSGTAATLSLDGVALPEVLSRAMGSNIETLVLRALLTRPLPRFPSSAAVAAEWRNQGGTLEVPEFSLRWGGFTASGHASLRLDGKLRPDAQGSIAVSGYGQALDALVAAGLLPRRNATAAAAVLALLAAPAQGRPITLPFEVSDGVLVLARFPLLRLPEFDWPELDRGVR